MVEVVEEYQHPTGRNEEDAMIAGRLVILWPIGPNKKGKSSKKDKSKNKDDKEGKSMILRIRRRGVLIMCSRIRMPPQVMMKIRSHPSLLWALLLIRSALSLTLPIASWPRDLRYNMMKVKVVMKVQMRSS